MVYTETDEQITKILKITERKECRKICKLKRERRIQKRMAATSSEL